MTMLSIIIATHNRADTLSKTLDSLLSQKIDGDFDHELIMVDNNSSDHTKEKISSYQEKFFGKLHYHFEPEKGKAAALNRGVKSATGDIIVFTDDDVILDPHWLSGIWRCFDEHDCDGVGGRVLPQYSKDVPQWVKDNAQQLRGPLVLYDYGVETMKYAEPLLEFFGANYAFKRRVFDECGFFRTDIGPGHAIQGEDTEFVKRVLNAGKDLYYCGEALVLHPAVKERATLKYIAQWNMTLGKYRFIVDEGAVIDGDPAYIFGAPHYLVKEIAVTALSLIIKVFNRSEFLKSWIQLFLKVGRMLEIRKRNKCAQSA